MTLIAPSRSGGTLTTRSFIPHVCHDAIGVLAAVTVATACVIEGTVCQGVARTPEGAAKTISVEHPTGEFSVELETDPANPQNVTKAALLRTRAPADARRGHGSRLDLGREGLSATVTI